MKKNQVLFERRAGKNANNPNIRIQSPLRPLAYKQCLTNKERIMETPNAPHAGLVLPKKDEKDYGLFKSNPNGLFV